MLDASSSTVQQRKYIILLEIFGRQCARRSVTVCRSRRIAFCALIRDRPPCCLLFSRQLWAPVRQTMHQSSNRMAAVNRSFALPSTGRPYGTIYGSGVSLSDSSPAGFKRTLKTHLFTLEQCRPSTGTAVTLQWLCQCQCQCQSSIYIAHHRESL